MQFTTLTNFQACSSEVKTAGAYVPRKLAPLWSTGSTGPGSRCWVWAEPTVLGMVAGLPRSAALASVRLSLLVEEGGCIVCEAGLAASSSLNTLEMYICVPSSALPLLRTPSILTGGLGSSPCHCG